MASAAAFEAVANQVCKAAGGTHQLAAGVACPVGVRLARRLIETRSLREAVKTTIPGRRVLINQTREFLGRPMNVEKMLRTVLKLAPVPGDRIAPGPSRVTPRPVAPMSRAADKMVQGMTGHVVHSFPSFFAQSDKFREFLQDPQRKLRDKFSSIGGDWFQPGESGF